MADNLFRKNYLTMIQNAAAGENRMFRNFYVQQNGTEKDVLEDGGLSCAVFVSSILYLHNSLLGFLGQSAWIKDTHARVASTEKDMLQNGWQEIQEFRPGAVLIWEYRNGDATAHEHMGFCISETEAISNDSKGTGLPFRHPIDKPSTVDLTPRKIEKILWHPALN